MSTNAQLAANRQNAQLSTGPVTAAGKQTVARNALKHGLYAKSPVIPGEFPEDYSALRDEILAEYRPRLAEETLLSEQLIDAIWRSRRVERLETAWFAKNPDPDLSDPKVFRVWAEFGRQHARYQRIIQTCLRRLSAAPAKPSAPDPIELALNLEIAKMRSEMRPIVSNPPVDRSGTGSSSSTSKAA